MTDPPDDISDLFKRPGATWSRAERERVVEWLFAERSRWLLATTSRSLRNYSRGIALPDGIVEDVLSEFLGVTINRVMDHYEPSKGSLFALIATAVLRLARDTAKKFAARGVIVDPSVSLGPDDPGIVIDPRGTGPSPYESLIDQERREALLRCLDRLRPKARAVVLLWMEGVTYAEMSKVVGLTADTAKQAFFHSKPILDDCLQQHRWAKPRTR